MQSRTNQGESEDTMNDPPHKHDSDNQIEGMQEQVMSYGQAIEEMKSTKVQTLSAIPGGAVRAHANEAIPHALIKCTCNGSIRNIARQKTETITCNGTYMKT